MTSTIMRTKTTVPPPMYIADVPFWLLERSHESTANRTSVEPVSPCAADESRVRGRRYFVSSCTELELPAESTT